MNNEQTALTNTPQNRMLSYEEIEKISKAFVASAMFGRDIDRVSKAVTKIMAGQELGMAPFAAMRAIHVIEGNATLSANTMAAMVKRSGKYDYEVPKKTATECQIDFYEIRGGKRYKVGSETFDKTEAQTAGLLNKSNWKNYPKAMLFARCMSNGVRTYCPDVFNGMLVYTPDEMGGKVDLSGDYANVIDVEVSEPAKPGKAEKPADPQPEAETPEPAAEPEPEIELDAEQQAEVLTQIDSLGLKGDAKIRFLKDTTGAVSPQSLKKPEQWVKLQRRVLDVLNGSEMLPPEWFTGYDPTAQAELPVEGEKVKTTTTEPEPKKPGRKAKAA